MQVSNNGRSDNKKMRDNVWLKIGNPAAILLFWGRQPQKRTAAGFKFKEHRNKENMVDKARRVPLGANQLCKVNNLVTNSGKMTNSSMHIKLQNY